MKLVINLLYHIANIIVFFLPFWCPFFWRFGFLAYLRFFCLFCNIFLSNYPSSTNHLRLSENTFVLSYYFYLCFCLLDHHQKFETNRINNNCNILIPSISNTWLLLFKIKSPDLYDIIKKGCVLSKTLTKRIKKIGEDEFFLGPVG